MTLKTILPSLAFLIIGMLFFIITPPVYSMFTMPPLIGRVVFAGIAILLFYYLSRAFVRFENLSLAAVRLVPNRDTWRRLVVGLLMGVLIAGAMLMALFTLTDWDVERVEVQTLWPFLLASLVFVPMAFMEELLFRGYPFFRLTQIIHVRWVILLTAILFAFYHYNSEQTVSSILLGPGIWGVTFGVAAYVSKSVAVPLGIHISANVLQALFGMKHYFNPMWTMTQSNDPLKVGMNAEYLGLTMQLILLCGSLLVLEWVIKCRKSNQT
ncbi:lysostaphin resistance A-like protein [Marinicella sp. W31]|uniref:CPBP family intramembrane glutamic endopeptidase n=1 Tax=Marinicella sp. W31 TaxID=3023713 RepID=UPI003757FCDE